MKQLMTDCVFDKWVIDDREGVRVRPKNIKKTGFRLLRAPLQTGRHERHSGKTFEEAPDFWGDKMEEVLLKRRGIGNQKVVKL